MPGSPEQHDSPQPNLEDIPEPEYDEPQLEDDQSSEDIENRKRDAEILGRSYKVRLTIDSGITAAATISHDKMAKFTNAMSTPKNAYLRVRHESAKDKHTRKEDKANTALLMAEQAHSEVGDGRIFTGKRRANRLQKKADRLQDKANDYKANTLDVRESAYTEHSDMMKGRTDKANQLRDKHEGVHKRKIEMYRDRKSLSEGNKELRKIRRDLRDKGSNKAEAIRTIGNVPVERRMQIGAVACLQEKAKRSLETTERKKKRVESRQKNNDAGLESNIQSVIDKQNTRDIAAKNLTKAEEIHGEYEGEVNDLRDQLINSTDHDETMLSNTDKAELTERLAKAEVGAEQAALRVTEASHLVTRLDAEIGSLERDINSRERNKTNLEYQAMDIGESHTKQSDELTALREERSRLVDFSTPVQLPDPDEASHPQPQQPVIPTTPTSQSPASENK